MVIYTFSRPGANFLSFICQPQSCYEASSIFNPSSHYHWSKHQYFNLFENQAIKVYFWRSICFVMTIHREGYKSIVICAILVAAINLASFYFISYNYPWLSWLIFIITFGFWLFIISFFRIPNSRLRQLNPHRRMVTALFPTSNMLVDGCIF